MLGRNEPAQAFAPARLAVRVVGAIAFLIELAARKGRDKLAGYDIATLISY